MNMITDRPDPNAAFPNPKIPSLCWDWDIEKIESNFEALSSGDLSMVRKIDR